MKSMTSGVSWQARRGPASVLADMALRREKIVATLLALRERHSLSQEQAATRIGITLRQYQRWEAGSSMPRPENLGRIAEAYDVSTSEFYDPDQEPPAGELADVLTELRAQREQLHRLGATLERRLAALERDVSELARRSPGGP